MMRSIRFQHIPVCKLFNFWGMVLYLECFIFAKICLKYSLSNPCQQ
uniref:Uncharacterized protein n=1 Tax=Arundo donax TaxID=35708 RepID=A0A0A8ZFY7_ARUDO